MVAVASAAADQAVHVAMVVSDPVAMISAQTAQAAVTVQVARAVASVRAALEPPGASGVAEISVTAAAHTEAMAPAPVVDLAHAMVHVALVAAVVAAAVTTVTRVLAMAHRADDSDRGRLVVASKHYAPR